MENCWEHLQIEPTANTGAIKKAYAKQLKFNKPDKNPEGFRELRAAYEQALNERWWYEESEKQDEKDEDEDEDFAENNDKEHDLSENGDLDKSNFTFNITPDMTSMDIELPEVTYTEIETEKTNHDEADDVYAIVEAVKRARASAELIADLEQTTIDEAGLESFDLEEQDFEASDLEENDLNKEIFTPYYYGSSHWSEKWQQICDDDVSHNESDATDKDQRLQAILQTQLDAPRALDEQNDFEEELLVWLADREPLFPLSYHLAKTHFRWDKRLEHWSHNEYPWYRLESLNQNYQHILYFESPTAFNGFLTQHYPVAASYLSIESLSEIKNEYIDPNSLKRISVFKQLFFPFWVTELAKELKALDAELEYYIYDHFAARQLALNTNSDEYTPHHWRHNSSFTTIKNWILHRFIQPLDFVKIAIVIFTLSTFFSYFSEQSRSSFYYDGLGMFAVISIYYLFWQLQLRLFATSDTFFSLEPWNTGWRNASVLLFILGYVSWLDVPTLNLIAAPTSPVYFLTHLAGFSLFAANSIRLRDVVVTATTWHAGVMVLILAVLVPLFIIVVAPPSHIHSQIFVISPLFWLLLAAPAFFISIGDTYPKLNWLSHLGYIVLKLWHSLMLIGSLILFIYCADIFPKLHFGFTAIIIFFITIVMALNMAVILGAFKED